MRILLIHRRIFSERPPVISVVQYLTELGYHPYVITTGINTHFKESFEKTGISYNVIPFEITRHFILNAIKGFIWGFKARHEIRKIAKSQDVVLWIEGNYTFDSLSPRFINKYPHILQHQEIPDPNVFKERIRMGNLRKIMPTALANLAPEYNRACLYRCFFRLKEPLYLLPNKPAFIPTREELDTLKNKYKDVLEKIDNRKIILYQGVMSGERSLENFVKAARFFDKKEYVTVLLGRTSKQLEKYKAINPNLIHIDYIPAPEYLLITSMAYIGFLAYTPNHIDLIYCAPNKIFEYGAFGIPMIGNDIPGLKYIMQDNGFGLICNTDSEDDIFNKFQLIISNYEVMSKRAREYYLSVDNKETIREVLENVKTKLKCEFD